MSTARHQNLTDFVMGAALVEAECVLADRGSFRLDDKRWNEFVLDRRHQLDGFDCGEPALDDWLKPYARAAQGSRSARVFVTTDGTTVAGYYALAASQIAPESATSRITRRGRLTPEMRPHETRCIPKPPSNPGGLTDRGQRSG